MIFPMLALFMGKYFRNETCFFKRKLGNGVILLLNDFLNGMIFLKWS